jgi:septal ring factor EnvC (AmiA/AmiB activator)
MRAEEAALAETIARLAEILDGFAVNSDAPFQAQRGALPWPVEGPLAAKFGDKRDENGLIRWTGVLLAAPAGTPVRAVYGGQVIHAQWHPHMGLLVIIDHGGGYWSLYGHNSALLRERGDIVRAGEIIAEVGNTGGQVESGLYFSILRDQQPLDPSDWVH